MQGIAQAKDVSAASTGTAYLDGASGSGAKTLLGVLVTAAAAVATVTVKEGDASGRVLVALSAPVNTSAWFNIPVTFRGNVWVIVTGAAAQAFVYEG